ncbi:hypothetical protein BKA69DRAFT_64976 [Paraphysoderma sedebokerense]|nr:hypothetical protein BKA69DRAFT_64976 [Paraphysoderma sedebokerense]
MFSSEFVNGALSMYPIDLSNRQTNSERIDFKSVKYPPRGIFLQGDGTLINVRDVIATNRIWFSSNNTGGADPYGNFTYIAIGPSNTSSVACTTRFKAVCSQSYLNVFNNNSGKICEFCAPGAACSVNGLFTPYADRGFLPCFPESACPGMENQICSIGRTGIRCATCKNGFYKFQEQCIPCTTQPSILVSLIIVAIVIGGLLQVIAFEAYTKGPSMGLLNITINFIQTILIIRNFRLSWPAELVQILDYLSFVKLTIDYSSLECLVADEAITFNYSFKMKVSLVVPFILLIVLVLCMGIWKIIVKLSEVVKQRHRSKSTDFEQSSLISLIKNYNMLLSFMFISLAQSSLGLFDCSLEVDQYYYLDSDLSLKCFGKWWWSDFSLAVVAVIAYVMGIPFYFFMLHICSHQTYYKSYGWIKMKSLTQQIFEADKLFQPQFQFFIFIQYIQKLLLAILDMFFTRSAVRLHNLECFGDAINGHVFFGSIAGTSLSIRNLKNRCAKVVLDYAYSVYNIWISVYSITLWVL